MCYHQNAAAARGFHQGRFGAGHHHGFGRWARHFEGGAAQGPVNIKESKDWYELFVYAPGLNKDAFQINVSDDILSIRFQGSESGQNSSKWLFQEFSNTGFERRFALNGKVDTASITARYVDGVLELTLPKMPGTEGQTVTVA